MTLKAFFDRILPPGGNYVVVTIDPRIEDPKRRAREYKPAESIEKLCAVVSRLSREPLNVYFLVGSCGASRNEPVSKRALFVDVDCKGGDGYASKTEAVAGLREFCRATGFPAPSVVVDSGNGIHNYWVLDRDLPVDEWRRLSEQLKAKCLELGFKIDPVCTADTKRILRAPGSFNQKSNPPTPCRVLGKDSGASFAPERLAAILAPADPFAAGPATAFAGAIIPEMQGGEKVYQDRPHFASEIATKCGLMKEAVDTGGAGHDEPLWSNLLSILAFTEDGEQFVHVISDKHPKYRKQDCDAKFQGKLSAKERGVLKPTRCTTFAAMRPAICAACPHNGLITSPIRLGIPVAVEFLPRGYRLTDYRVEKLIKKATAEGESDLWITAFPYGIQNVELISNGEQPGERLRMTLVGKRKHVGFELDANTLYSQGGDLGLAFAAKTLYPDHQHISEFKTFMPNWLRRMKEIKESTKTEIKGMGWGLRDKQVIFSTGSKYFTAKGDEREILNKDTMLAGMYTPKGDPSVWTSAAKSLLDDECYPIVSTVLSAFAAPLMQFTGHAGVAFAIHSPQSGTGKSAAMRLAQAVWGNPRSGMHALKDTPNSVVAHLSFANNLPMYWDELRSPETGGMAELVQFIFQLCQGKEKSRMRADLKLQDSGNWATIFTLASNEKLTDHVDANLTNTDAGRLRIFEITVPKRKLSDVNKVAQLEGKLDFNYGHAGAHYARWLVANHVKVERLVMAFKNKTAVELTADPNERFWVALLACLLAAAEITHRIGLLNIDRQKYKEWLYEEFYLQRGDLKTVHKDPRTRAAELFFKYVDAHRDQMVVCETMPRAGNMSPGALLVTPPVREILVMKAVNDNMIRVKCSHFGEWLIHNKESRHTVFDGLTRLGARTSRGSVSAGVNASSGTRYTCLTVDLTSPEFAEFADTVDRISETT